MRQALSHDRIVTAAIALADRDGPEAVTMRRLGRELGVEGMALYGHFASKAELLGAVADELLAELALEPAPGAAWQDRVRHVIASWAGLRDRHPGAFPLLYARRDWTSREFAPIEEILDALRAAGLPPARSLLAYQALVWMLDGILLGGAYGSDAPVAGAWRHGAGLAESDAFPRYVEAAPHAADLAGRTIFEFGAELLVRGLEQLVG